VKRRAFVLSALGAGGSLLLGWSVSPPASRLGAPSAEPDGLRPVALNGWIRIHPDSTVGIAVPRCEMGQGVWTALPMLVAEELEVEVDRVRVEAADDDPIFANLAAFAQVLPVHPDRIGSTAACLEQWFLVKIGRELGLQITGGSSSVADAWLPMRQAGAAARSMLLQAAARRWSVPVASCRARKGIIDDGGQRRLSYGELAASAARLGLPARVDLKSPERFELIGRPQARVDGPDKVSGRARFGIDVRLPGMLFASVRACPSIGGELASFDGLDAEQMNGVLRVSPYEGQAGCAPGVAVVARDSWTAFRAVERVRIRWSEPAGPPLETEGLFERMRAGLEAEGGWVFERRGDAPAALRAAHQVIRARYEAPWLAHATMEPMNCTAQFEGGRLKLWVPTQVSSVVRRVAGRLSGLASDRIDLTVTLLGGGFGRRLEVDVLWPAILLARQMAPAPVQVLWPREEDMTHDFYRPAAVARFEGGLDSGGRVTSWVSRTASDAVGPQFLRRAFPWMSLEAPDKTTAEGHFDQAYEIAHRHCSHARVALPVPIGNWRSVGHSHNAFFSESFIDELAFAAGSDPLEFRRAMLRNHARHRAVLDLAAAEAGWGQTPAAGRARGIALHESFGSVVAQVAEVSLQEGQIRVHRVVCAIDCGIAVNPNLVAQQMEGAVVFGLSAALYGRITFHDGQVQQRNFPDYPILRMSQAPIVQTHIVPSRSDPSGVGEPGTPPIAAAVANALHALTGQRHRTLPLAGA
jgi:isoquinoline 1-oxidoreductase subunit beta